MTLASKLSPTLFALAFAFICLETDLRSAKPQLTADEHDWFRWRGPQLNGVSTESNWSHDWGDKPKVSWMADVGTGFSSVVVCDGVAYTQGFRDEKVEIVALDVDTGERRWTRTYPATLDDRDFEGGATSTPTCDEGRVYVLSRVGELLCLDGTSGEIVWRTQVAEAAQVRLPGWGFAAAPLIVGDQVLVNVGEFGAAVDKTDGSLKWSSPDRESGYGAPVLMPNSPTPAAIFASSRSYIAVNILSGEELWRERWLTTFGCNAADAIVQGDEFFLSSGYNRGAAMFKRNADGQPEAQWKSKEMQNQLHGSILYKGHLYGLDGDMEAGAHLKCMKWSTGETLWSEADLRPGGLALADDRLIVLTDSGELLIAAASPDGFRSLARGKVLDGKCWTVPVLSNGRIYCRSVAGQVASIDVRG